MPGVVGRKDKNHHCKGPHATDIVSTALFKESEQDGSFAFYPQNYHPLPHHRTCKTWSGRRTKSWICFVADQ